MSPSVRHFLFSAFFIIHYFIAIAASAKVYLCGDSTMAKGGQGVEGWGEHLHSFLTIPVENRAIGGRSARSFTNEGRFDAVAAMVAPGDIVVIEFGRNDGGSLQSDTLSRVPCPGGSATQTCSGTYKDKPVTVYTFPKYLALAGQMMTKKGANVIYSSMTPHNIFWTQKGGPPNLNPTPPKFVEYAKAAVQMTGAGASYVDHWNSTVAMYRKLGKEKVGSFFGKETDPVHTNAIGAKAVASSFADAVLLAGDPLAQYVKTS
jgi:rhamnogalacturonan acetylesterase